jgi:signal peptidase I
LRDAGLPPRRRILALPWIVSALPLALALAAWLAGVRLSRFVVRGPSMEPALTDGDRLLVLRLPPWAMRPPPDAIVIGRPRALDGAEIVKRVAKSDARHGRRGYALLGDNPVASTDSRSFGPVRAAEIAAIVLLRYWPDARRGRIPRQVTGQPPGSETRPSASVRSWSRARPSSSPVSQGRSGGP